MAGPTSPGTEGPTFAPPPLPPGWIAQWDGASRKYYFVQLSTGVSQWDTPTEAAPTGSTPAQPADHPYGTPQPEVITHPDGSQTVRHADGTMEPILPSDGSRGVDGPAGERGFGSMAMNALLSGGKQHGGQNSSPFALAGQLFGGSSHSGGHGGGAGGSNPAGKLVGSLVSSLVTPSNKPAQPQNYYGGQNSQQPQNTGGLAGAVMGGVAHMFGGKPAQQTQQSFGYSNSGNSGGYTGQAPPASYQPPGSSAQYTAPAATAPSGTSSYQAPSSEPQAQYYQQPPPSQPQQQHGPSYGPPPGQPQQSTPYTNYPPPNPQHPLPSAYGQPGVQHGTSHPQNPHGGNHPGGHPPPHHQQPYAPQQQYAIPSTGAPTQPGFGGNAQYAAPQSNYNAPYSHSAGSAPPGTSYAGQPPYNSPPPPGASY